MNDRREFWSAGKARTWMAGMRLFDSAHGCWWMGGPEDFYVADPCGESQGQNVVRCLPKRVAILTDFHRAVGRPTVVILNPLAALHERWPKDRAGRPKPPKLRGCKSPRFNGALVSPAATAAADLEAAVAFHADGAANGSRAELTVVFTRPHVLVRVCDHSGFHLAARDRPPLEAFARLYARHVGDAPTVWWTG